MAKRKRIENPRVAATFASYPRKVKEKLLFLRQLIFDVAAETEGVGEIEEALKWGQPSYLTTKSRSGSLIRIDQIKSRAGAYAMYFHCQTMLVNTFKAMFRDKFKFERNRAIVFDESDRVPVRELSECIALALTYHLNRRGAQRRAARHSTTPAARLRGDIAD